MPADYRIRSNVAWVVLSLVLLLAAVALVVYVVMTT
jgi:nitric oxide reductase large subunit